MKRLLFVVSVAAGWTAAGGYEVETHRLLSRAAAARSVALGAGTGNIYSDLNLAPAMHFPDSTRRYRTPADLIGFGAVNEDREMLRRALSHFYDPQHGGRPLTAGLKAVGYPSPDWALEDRGPLAFSLPLPEQHYSLRDGYDYFRLAISAPDEAERFRYFGLMFQTLGHAVHHLQDMAQPEHVRNDAHLEYWDTSLYEKWTDARRASLPLDGYAPLDWRDFPTARSFWAGAGKGMAEFTGFNFVSKDTNFRRNNGTFSTDPQYPRPAVAPNPPLQRMTLSAVGIASAFPNAELTFVGADVADAMRPALSRFNPRASTFSMLSQNLGPTLTGPFLSLNRFNFAAAHEFLMPRAVAYSAGLIDYFFRGRLALKSISVANGQLIVTVANASGGGFALRDGAHGESEFAIYYDTEEGQRRRLTPLHADLAGDVIAPAAVRELSFPLPSTMNNRLQKPFVLVFDGVIGEEPGIAALALDAPPLSGFLVQPSYLPADGLEGKRLITADSGAWTLSARTGLRAGNVDWKGWLPGDVLTWDGPPSRYFFPKSVWGYSAAIYFNGAQLATAPGTVLGAAFRYVGETRELLAITYDGSRLHLYKRPFPRLPADARLYHPGSNPEGWRELHVSAEGAPRTPFFFNASAGEGQVIAGDVRVRLRLDGDTVSRSAEETAGRGSLLPLQQSAGMTAGHSLEVGRQDEQAACPAMTRTEVCTEFETLVCEGVQIRDLCTRSQLVAADSMSAHSSMTEQTYTQMRPQVICADYSGDNEVLCTVTLQDAGLSETSSLSSQSTTEYDMKRLCNPISQDMRFAQNSSGESRVVTGGLYVLEANGMQIPLSGMRRESRVSMRATMRVDNSVTQANSQASETIESVTHDSRILYLDVRNALAVYEEHSSEEHTTIAGAATGTATAVDGSGERQKVARSQIVVLMDGSRVVPQPDERRQQEVVAAPVGFRAPHLEYSPSLDLRNLALRGFGCPPFDGFSDTWTPSPPQETVENKDWLPFVHPKALLPGAQGYAIDSEGRRLISQPLWKRATNGSYSASAQWNYLSGSDLAQIIPVAPERATYGPVGPVR